MVKRRGGVVVGTTSSGEKVELALQAGADHVVGYDRFRDIVDEASDGAGAHVVYDGVGHDTFDDGLAALRPRGMMVLYGAASGQVPPVDPQRLNSGGSLFPHPAHPGALHRRRHRAAVARGRGVRLDHQGRARRADRWHRTR
jgi:NADPH:quinone reductase and related Zn-dependent oxidoreductases